MNSLGEIRTLLQEWEELLLEHERRPKPENIHRFFQLAHGLKGLCALAGLERAASRLHGWENILDRLRRGENPEGLDVSEALALVDALREAVDAGQDLPEVRPAPKAASVSTAKALVWEHPLGAVTVRQILRHVKEGKALYILHKTFRTSLSERQWASLPLFRSLAEVGWLYCYHPPPSAWDRRRSEVVVAFLFTSEWARQELERRFLEPVHLAELAPDLVMGVEDERSPIRLRVLVIEDDPLTLKLLQLALQDSCQVQGVSSGKEGMKIFFEAHTHGQPFHVVILDQMLPDGDGQQLLSQIRGWERQGLGQGGRTAVFINTALDDYELVQKAFRNLADGYFVKPFSMEKIFSALDEVRRRIGN